MFPRSVRRAGPVGFHASLSLLQREPVEMGNIENMRRRPSKQALEQGPSIGTFLHATP
jgi:hypothetical protein